MTDREADTQRGGRICGTSWCNWNTRAVLAIVVLGTLAATGCSDSSNSGSNSALSDGSERAGFYDTPWPSEHADRWRTQAAKGGLPHRVQSADLVATSAELPPFPVLGYTRGDYVYVMGGSAASMELYTDLIQTYEPGEALPTSYELVEEEFIGREATPYVAKIDPETMSVGVLELTEGESYNYIGGMLMHENGSIYAVAQSVLYKINADGFFIEDSLELPLLVQDGRPDEDTTYNGIQVRANGQIVLKGIDIPEQASAENTDGILLLVDPDTMEITARTDSDRVGTPRLTLAVQDGIELLYHSTANESERFVVTDLGFDLDEPWTVAYRPTDESGTQSASSPVYMNKSDAVVFANNTLPFSVTTPMLLYSQSTISNAGGPLTGLQALDDSNPQINWYLVSADPYVSNIVVVRDQLSGRVAGWRLSDDTSLSKVWETDDYAASAGSAIAYEQGHLYIDDRRCDTNGENCTLWLIVLDIESGDQLAEVQVAGTLPSNSQTFVGSDAVYFIATEADSPHGYITRVSP